MIGIALGVGLLCVLAYLLLEGRIHRREAARWADLEARGVAPTTATGTLGLEVGVGDLLVASELNALQTLELEDGWDWPAAPAIGLGLFDQAELEPARPPLELVSTPRGYVLQPR